ncbi:hypothetical protein CERSUDRAFT_68276 [Gelatoporia subvermispora B]|uniref:Fungal N-terminal domain-containing protein n=1 Tax=Ceriporiopsis subvermispora (strain B) TaxID=914234 RepID=M2QM54_CERS8|nr:hypothetical protein CERSUDRAFT_68276 [Gelatoporia subvermispora B]
MGKKSNTTVDILGASITALEILKDGSNAISVIPRLGAVLARAPGLLKTIEKVYGFSGECKRLAQRTAELIRYIEKQITDNVHDIDADLTTNLEQLSVLLKAIRIDVVELKERKLVLKPPRSTNSIAEKLSDHTEALDSAWRSFGACCLLSMNRKVKKQMEWNEDQRESDENQVCHSRVRVVLTSSSVPNFSTFGLEAY